MKPCKLFFLLFLLSNSCSIFNKEKPKDLYNDPGRIVHLKEPEEDKELTDEVQKIKKKLKEAEMKLRNHQKLIGIELGKMVQIEKKAQALLRGEGYAISPTTIEDLFEAWADTRDELFDLIEDRADLTEDKEEVDLELKIQIINEIHANREREKKLTTKHAEENYEAKLEEIERNVETSKKKIEGRKKGLKALVSEEYHDILD